MVTLTAPEDYASRLNAAQGNFGVGFTPSLVGNVSVEGPAAEAGIRPGDRILAIGERPVAFWVEMAEAIQETQLETSPLDCSYWKNLWV